MPARVASRLPATLALVGATAVWGSTFLVTKVSLPGTTPATFLTWRFGLAAAVLVLVRPGLVREVRPTDRRRALVLGLALGAGFLLQTLGLVTTPTGLSGFLTGTAVVLTPVVAAACFGEVVGRTGWTAVGTAVAGLALLGFRGGGVTAGAVLVVAGAGCFAVHIAGLSRWATAGNAYGITAWSVGVAATVCAAVAALRGDLAVLPTLATLGGVLYLALAATCLGFVVQAWAQAALSATSAAVIMTSEPVFAAAVAVAIGGEILGGAAWAGGALLVAAMFLAELGPRHCCDALSPRVECC